MAGVFGPLTRTDFLVFGTFINETAMFCIAPEVPQPGLVTVRMSINGASFTEMFVDYWYPSIL